MKEMKKTKKIIASLLVLGTALSTMPVMAEDPTVGVKITGNVAIDAVATIKADINVDVNKGTANSTYLEIKNNSNVPASAKITNITSQTPGAPSNFISADENASMSSAGIEDTKSKIGFYVTNHTHQFEGKNIQPSTEVNLGNLAAANPGVGGHGDDPITLQNGDTLDVSTLTNGSGEEKSDEGYFEIIPYVGYAWENTNQTFKYAITVVFTASEDTVNGASWSNLAPEFKGLKNTHIQINKSNQGNWYVVVGIYYDSTQLDNIQSYDLSSYTNEITIVSDDGNVYTKKLGSGETHTSSTFSPEIASYTVYPVDLAELSSGTYYMGMECQLVARAQNVDENYVGRVGAVINQGIEKN